jgi:diguanylate cyclase (GGDEF)-like protein
MRSREPIVLADMMLRQATKRDVAVAGLLVSVLCGATLASWHLGRVQWPTLLPFIPISATLWCTADLLTAFLLLTQFSVNGIRAFAFLGAAYAYTGLMTIPYVIFAPALFFAEPSVAMGQMSTYLWLDWHLVFPAIIAGYSLFDPDFRLRLLSGARIRLGLWVGLIAVVLGAVAVTTAVILLSDRLPRILEHGHFLPIWAQVYAPSVVACNLIAAALVLRTRRKVSLLQLWIAVALITAAFDALLNAWALGRYTVSWYLGKAETLLTASVVMLMLLSEVGALYRRLGTMAIIDPLTGLRNRRSFDEYLHWSLGRREQSGVAFLLLDIDYFKEYNDLYGHAGGDACLIRVADTLRDSLWRSVDLVARYGGEEFVILLPDTTAAGGFEVAERVRRRIEALAIDRCGFKGRPVHHSERRRCARVVARCG